MSTNFSLRIPAWDIDWYKPQTTFWQDFWIATQYGADAVQDTYDRAFKEWKGNCIYMTELSLVLNYMGWALHGRKANLAQLFFKLWDQHIDWCYENLKGEDLDYFLRITD